MEAGASPAAAAFAAVAAISSKQAFISSTLILPSLFLSHRSLTALLSSSVRPGMMPLLNLEISALSISPLLSESSLYASFLYLEIRCHLVKGHPCTLRPSTKARTN